MNFNVYQKVCFAFFVALVIFWIALRATGSENIFLGNLYVFLYGLIPLLGGLAAIIGYLIGKYKIF